MIVALPLSMAAPSLRAPNRSKGLCAVIFGGSLVSALGGQIGSEQEQTRPSAIYCCFSKAGTGEVSRRGLNTK
jgi:hypothetical protein